MRKALTYILYTLLFIILLPIILVGLWLAALLLYGAFITWGVIKILIELKTLLKINSPISLFEDFLYLFSEDWKWRSADNKERITLIIGAIIGLIIMGVFASFIEFEYFYIPIIVGGIIYFILKSINVEKCKNTDNVADNNIKSSSTTKHDNKLIKEKVTTQSTQTSIDCKHNIQLQKHQITTEHILRIGEDLPDDIYKDVAIAFAESVHTCSHAKMDRYISEEHIFLDYGNQYIYGKSAYLKYWENHYCTDDHLKSCGRTIVDVCNYYSHAAVFNTFKNKEKECLLFRIVGTKVTHITRIPLEDKILKTPNLEECPFDYEFIMKNITGWRTSIPNKMWCLECGEYSENLEWHSVDFKSQDKHYKGLVSSCSHCKKVVEFLVDSNSEIENSEECTIQPIQFELPETITTVLFYSQPLFNTSFCENLDKNNIHLNKEVTNLKPCSLFECTVEFKTPYIGYLTRYDYPSYEKLKECYITAYNNGIHEAAINVGILLADYEKDNWEGIEWIKKAAKKGSINAINNLYILLERENEHLAYYHLREICESESPTIFCLWNLAVLQLWDRHCYPVVNKSYSNCVELLKRIITTNWDNSGKENFLFIQTYAFAGNPNHQTIFLKANILLKYLQGSNEYGIIGAEFRDFLMNLEKDGKVEGYEINFRLNHLLFYNDIYLHLAKDTEMGDYSYFYINKSEIEKSSDPEDYMKEILEITCSESGCSEIAAWQIYLLSISSRMLPTYWHGAYTQRTYIFSTSELDSIKAFGKKVFMNKDISSIINESNILPHVILGMDNTAYVSCCYWNDWQGLVREHVKIEIHPRIGVTVNKTDIETLYKYDCGIFL